MDPTSEQSPTSGEAIVDTDRIDRVRVRAPRLQGRGGWLNTPEPLDLEALRGRVVVLDFWTSSCVNCLHVVEELRPLEARYPDELVVIGVHSPKFAHETDHAAVAAAVQRYDIGYPVLDDPDLSTWRQYAVKAWPTLVVIDPLGYIVARAAGEGHVRALEVVVGDLITQHIELGTLRPRQLPIVGGGDDQELRFPAKAILLPAARTGRAVDTVLVADAGHHRLAELGLDGVTRLRTIGTGERGRDDGGPDAAALAEPGGLALLPPGVAHAVSYDVVVADTANHLIRGVRLADGSVQTVADLGLVRLQTVTGPVPGVMSPWDVIWWPAIERVVVAAAGVHLLLSFDPRDRAVEILAGTTVEGLRDGPALDGWLAQPSGLAVQADRLWFVDAETSSLRWLTPTGDLHTAVGEGLFDFGLVDGPASTARLQHPLGVDVLDDGSIAIMDTYNGAVRRYDPATRQVSTVLTGLAEPSGAVGIDGRLLVVESAFHRLTMIELDTAEPTSAVEHPEPVIVLHVTVLEPGPVTLTVRFTPAPGRVVDDRFGPAVRLSIKSSPPAMLRGGAGDSTELARRIETTAGAGVLHVTAQVASCDHDPAVANPACYLSRQDWDIPVRIEPGGATEMELALPD